MEQSVFLDVAARTASAISGKKDAAKGGAIDGQSETAAVGHQLDGMQQRDVSGTEQPKLHRSEAHKQRQSQHFDDGQQDERLQQQQQHGKKHSAQVDSQTPQQQQQLQGKSMSRAELFTVQAWQKVDEHYKAKEQQHGHLQDVLAKQRSQQELESLSVPGCWPSEGLKCLLRDGSQVDMFDGMARLLLGMHLAGLEYAFASASCSVACCWLHIPPLCRGSELCETTVATNTLCDLRMHASTSYRLTEHRIQTRHVGGGLLGAMQ